AQWPQNFLREPHWVARIVEAIAPQAGERIVEIGPGLAAMTTPLIARAGHISAVEIDRDLAARLRERFEPSQLDVIEADALSLDWAVLADQAPQLLRIVGNLPYNISTPLLFALMPIADRVIDQHFMLQKEVVDRMVAPPGGADYGRLSVMLQRRYVLERLFDVPPEAFYPAPQVVSSIVRLRPRPAQTIAPVDEQAFARVVAAAFGQRRKTLRNALAGVVSLEQMTQAGIDPQVRAQQLDLECFERLAQHAMVLDGKP
ncbi:MAG TPA: 16S rRNA (adenine(1518)-N(6)/adenine(1519)-N(6))-dimethyltransferase RsmA, partial [Burkholderiaceae bacterium]|nr:16S rRNA (adenine(1518)-N(6)/adenine(1519)-N(6))-dimethyltransferase RsmA [Burkholderiaceae bacterium]